MALLLLAIGCDRPRDDRASPSAAAPASTAPGAASGKQARRVVTTTPSSTEIVAAAGGADRIVGVDRFSTYPPRVVGLPVVGDFMSPSVEAILQLRPDLVVLDKVQTKTAAALAQGGVRTLVLEMQTVEDVLAGLTAAGAALGTEDAARAARDSLRRDIEAVRARGHERAHRVRALVVVDRELGALRGIVAAGPGSYLDELLAVAGADNVLAGAATRYASIAPETVIESRPEVILDAVHTGDPAAAARDWKALPRVPAVAAGRVHLLTEPYYIAPGPRVGLALRGLEAALYP
ncbi:MAG TPA: helical backbone metal receptor [Kofleriaceae bacterium]|nr:helical backbone metal receptor [Kofleriaceae bacterium]